MPGQNVHGHQNSDTHDNFDGFIHVHDPTLIAEFGIRIADLRQAISNILLAFQSFGALYFSKY